ncbi:MAG: tetratricopeptide repeat protein [Candidatus Eisenbacteria bacterium]|nr:tetratricopeptide repeat protein [Candidatus Eisenbacteria bacterium]
MTKCPYCNHQPSESARFCENCGAILQRNDPAYQLAYAHRLEMEGRFGEAIAEYEKLIEKGVMREQLPALRKHLGNLHFRMGHLRRAKEHLRAACEMEPGNAAFWHDLGVVEYHGAEFDDAIAAFQEALVRDADLLLAYFWLGNALYHRGRNDEAIEAFGELLDRYPNFMVGHFHLGVIHARRGNVEEAEGHFRKILQKNPEAAAAQFYVTPESS